jgi:transposase
MYMRTVSRKNKDGTPVRYIQLAHNEWDPVAKYSKAKVLYNFGRESELDFDALKRLVASISRFLTPEDALKAQATIEHGNDLKFISSKPYGGAWLLNELWKHLEIDVVLKKLLEKRQYRIPVERVLFALVANRALEPVSKLACEDWVEKDAVLPGIEHIEEQQMLRSMDFLLEANEEIQKEVFFSAAHLLNLEVDLLFFDTTSSYFETEPVSCNSDNNAGDFRKLGLSKDHRPDLPQVVIGLAVTREGIPVRCWVWSGNTADMTVIKEVKKDLMGWRLGRVVTVIDRGFSSEDNLKTLQVAGGHYIAGEKLSKSSANEALSRPGRYRTVKDNLEIKEIIVGDGEARVRYVLSRNPQEAKRDRLRREDLLKKLKSEMKIVNEKPPEKRASVISEMLKDKTWGRYLRLDDKGCLRLNQQKITEEERKDGKYLIRTSDDTLSAEDVALGYKQLYEVEDAFRTLKSTLELRPMYHRLEDRIKSHVLLCWLALLLIRVAETRTVSTWSHIRKELQRIHLGVFKGVNGEIHQRTELTKEQKEIFKSVKVSEPPMFHKVIADQGVGY